MTSTREWHRPKPNRALMRLLGVVNRWFLVEGLPVLRRIPGVRDWAFVHGYFWVRHLELPAADRRMLEHAVNRETVAFIGPNHPEFGTDWMIDKVISGIVAPYMASWADRSIVSGAPRFWGMNNLIANDGGDAAREYSVEWALEGEGVLLHPEGTVRWTNDVVNPLFPGIAQMAIQAARDADKPVYIVSLVWKYRYVGDVTARILREMDVIERGLKLPGSRGRTVPERFRSLQSNLLDARMSVFGYEPVAIVDDFFERQEAFQRRLLDALGQRYTVEAADTVDKQVARLTRAIRRELAVNRGDRSPAVLEQRTVLERDVAMADEAKRLGEFSRDVYGGPTLTQEQVFESLKRTRDRLLRHGWKNSLAIMLPRPFGPRVVHIGVPEPIRVTSVEAARARAYEAELIERTRAAMQARLDEINRMIEPLVAPYRMPNPFARDGSA